jgi:hypothetical protein
MRRGFVMRDSDHNSDLEKRVAVLEKSVLSYYEALRDHREALKTIREAVQLLVPPDYFSELGVAVTPAAEAQAIVGTLRKIAQRLTKDKTSF